MNTRDHLALDVKLQGIQCTNLLAKVGL